MAIKIFNTVQRQKELFVPLVNGKVSMYVCGPTVYNYIHIGNARPAVVFDTVRRYFEYSGYTVNYVSNFTDVDDRLIRAANIAGTSVPEIAEQFIKAFKEDVAALNVRPATVNPRATQTMPEIIRFVAGLVNKGFAYEVDGDVYFRARKFSQYGKLSHQSIEALKAGARVEVDERKEDPLDFALWKRAKEGEIKWRSPWGEGRPGWHIECSAMVEKYLGETIDIHAGGSDLIFPHHENEIAQSEALHGKTMARYWMHNGHIQINHEKMSKSLGNVVLVRDLVHHYDPQALRFFILSVHYRHPINFSDALIEDAVQALTRLKTAFRNLSHRLQGDTIAEDSATLSRYREKFSEAMDDDFNTANAEAVLFDIVREANAALPKASAQPAVLHAYQRLLQELSAVLGVTLCDNKAEFLANDVEALIQKREEARQKKDYALSDAIRRQLTDKGIILEDTAQGVRWRRG